MFGPLDDTEFSGPLGRQRAGLRVRLVAGLAALLLLVAGVSIFEIERSRQEYQRDAETATAFQALAFAENTQSSIKRLNELLLDLRSHWSGDWQAFARQVTLRHTNFTDLTFQLAVIDAEGKLAFSNLERTREPIDLSDREHFLVHKNSADDRLFISRPIKGRVSGKWSIQFTRAIHNGNSFQGVLVASVSPEALTAFHQKLDLSPSGATHVVRSSGEILARHPDGQNLVGKVVSVPSAASDAPLTGNFTRVAQLDGVERVFGYHKLPGYELTFIVGESLEHVMIPQQRRQRLVIAAAAAVSLLLTVLTWLLYRSLASRAEVACQLQNSEKRFRSLIEASPIPYALNDQAGNVLYLNQAFVTTFGYTLKDIPTLHSWWPKAYPDPGYRALIAVAWEEHIEQARRDESPFRAVEASICCKDGTTRTVLVSTEPVETGFSDLHVVTFYDITERKQTEQTLAELNRDFISFLENTSDFIYFKDADSRFRFCSQTLAHITGHAHWRDMIGKHDSEVFPAETARIYAEEEQPIFREAKPLLNKEDPYFDANGVKRWVSTSKWPLVDADQNVIGLFGISRDITEHRLMEEQVQQLAFYDPLTRLPNRRLLGDRLKQAIATNKRNACHAAVMFLDLDNFKPLNDLHGHEVGDLLLIEVAKRISDCVREVDTVARFGGDEYVIILSELAAKKNEAAIQARIIAAKIHIAVASPYDLIVKSHQGSTTIRHRCTASIGIVMISDLDASQDEILMRADMAMYEAKHKGRNQVHFYEKT